MHPAEAGLELLKCNRSYESLTVGQSSAVHEHAAR